MKHYVELRLEFYYAGVDRARLQRAESRAKQVQDQLWAKGALIASEDPRAVTTGLFLEALNEVIDLDAKRLVALEYHVPETIWTLLVIVAGVGTLITGYASGLGNQRTAFSAAALPAVIAVVMTIILDIDRPRRGLIHVSQQSLLWLQADMAADTGH